MGRTPTLDEVRDAILVQDLREKSSDQRERLRQKLRDMGFSERAISEHRWVEDPKTNEVIPPKGLIAAYLEDKSRRFHGVDPDATDRKSGRKRRKNAKATARRGYEALYGEG